MLESAQLFTATDTTVLTATAAVLHRLAGTDAKLPPAREALSIAAMDLVERAYHLESNWNTRGFYSGIGLDDRRPEVASAVANHIWSTRDSEPWWPSVVDAAFVKFIELENDWVKREKILVDSAPMYEKRKDGLRTLMWAVKPFFAYSDAAGNKKNAAARAAFAASLIAKDDLYLKSIGHLAAIDLASREYSVRPEASLAKDFLQHYRAALELTPQLEALYPNEFAQSTFTMWLNEFLLNQTKMLHEAGLQDEVLDLKVQYVLAQLQKPKADLSNIPNALRQLLPALRERQQNESALTILTVFLDRYNYGGSGNYDRMEFIRAINEFSFANAKHRPLQLDQLTAVPFDDNNSGSIPRMVAGKNGVFGVRQAGEYYSGGKAFRIAPQSNRAEIIAGPTAVHDIAYTDKTVGVGTWKNGLFLIDALTLEARQLTPANSALPGATVSLLTNDGADFLIGVPDKENLWTLFYRLEPDAGRLTATESKYVTHLEWKVKATAGAEPIVAENWNSRSTIMNGKQLNLKTDATQNSSKEVTVTSEGGENLLRYRGFELTYVNEFLTWQNYLVFATGNGLYISKPGSNKLHCILSEPDLRFESAVVIGQQMVLGTSKGIYILDAAAFLEAANKAGVKVKP